MMIRLNRPKGVIAVRSRRVGLGVLAVALIFALTACTGFFDTPQQGAMLIFGDPVASGTGGGQFIISVVEMPHGGLASISLVSSPGFYSGMANLTIEGLNGFTVLAFQVNDVTGEVKFVAARADGGTEGGTVARIRFDYDGTPDIDDSKIGTVVLGSDYGTIITGYTTVTDGKDYYTK